jgi:alkyl hydroperoxide reductase subunit AhpC
MKKKISNISILNKNNLNKKLAERYELKNFLKNKVNFFKKKNLTFLATFNIIFFFSKYRELGNLNNNLYS